MTAVKVVLFGATGMVGQGVLRECVLARDVQRILLVGRSAVSLDDPKLEQLVLDDLLDLSHEQDRFRGYDACFFCLGSSASGDGDEAEYRRINHDLPLATAKTMFAANPAMTFVYVSGAGTDATERGSTMWARVKGSTENALRRVGFKAVYCLRPAFIVPLNGAVSKTRTYRLLYGALGWAFSALRRVFPSSILDTEQMGRAMLQLVHDGPADPVIDSAGIHRLARRRTMAAPPP